MVSAPPSQVGRSSSCTDAAPAGEDSQPRGMTRTNSRGIGGSVSTRRRAPRGDRLELLLVQSHGSPLAGSRATQQLRSIVRRIESISRATAPPDSSRLARTVTEVGTNDLWLRPVSGDACLGRVTRFGPGFKYGVDNTCRRPPAVLQPTQRAPAAQSGVAARPVVGRRQPAVLLAPRQHRRDHQLPRPAALNRAGMAARRGTTPARCPCGSFSDAALPNPA